MGFDLKLFLEECVRVGWISKEVSDHIFQNMDTTTSSLIYRMSTKIWELEFKLAELKDKP